MSRTKSIDEEKMLQQNRKGSKIVTEVYESPAPDLAILNVIKGRRELLVSHEIIVNLIAGTTTRAGLKIEAELDTNVYPTGIKVTDEELKNIRIEKAAFHGEWNYTVIPKNESCST